MARESRRHKHLGYIVPRLHLDMGLLTALKNSGARVFEGQRVNELVRENGTVCGARGPALSWSSRVVIATDGYSSLGTRASARPFSRSSQVAVSATAYYRGVSFPHGTDVSEHFFEEELVRGYAWICPPVDGLANVGVYMRADAYVESTRKLPQLLQTFLERHPDRFASAERVSAIRRWPLPLAPRSSPVSEPGLLLAGDAAGLVDPFSGEGIWQALSSGYLAGSITSEALSCVGLSDGLRARYARTCNRLFVGPGRRKLWAQELNEIIMKHQLFRRPTVRTLLRWGWGHSLFDAQQSIPPVTCA